jgi:hypothetical protein
MAKTPGQPNAVDADTQACSLDENDKALTDEIDIEWMDKMTDRVCRQVARQVMQSEKAPNSTLPETRVQNARALDILQRTLERLARQESARAARRSTKNSDSDLEALAALERRLFAQLEHGRSKHLPGESQSQ